VLLFCRNSVTRQMLCGTMACRGGNFLARAVGTSRLKRIQMRIEASFTPVGSFVVSRGDAAVVLDFVGKALDEIFCSGKDKG
jgi:hypothetical protein